MKKNLLIAGLMIAGLTSFSQTTRLSLFEEFTGETCPPCASTNPGLNATLTANSTKVIAIKWQVPIPSAPTNTWSLYQTNSAEINTRMSYYAVNSAPQGRMDGQSLTVFGASSDHAANVSPGLINTAQAITSPFSINMVRAWDPFCSSVNLTITVQATANFTTASALNFRTVMVERLIQFSVQPGTNGEKNFEDAAIKSFPTVSGYGLPTAWTIGQTQTFTLNCPIPSYTRKKDEVAFVGFIQNEANKNVLQAFRVDKVAIPTDALTALDAKVDVTCSSNITPQVTVKNNGLNPLTSFTVTPYTDGVAGTTTPWAGNLAVGASTTLVLNTTSTGTTSGSHTFSFTVLMNSPYNFFNVSNKVNYLVASNYQTTPIIEDFSLSTFPPTNWTRVNSNNGPSWSRVVNVGSYANSADYGAIKFDFYTNPVPGDVDELYLPPIDLSGSSTPNLSFDIAKAQRISENDQLDVFVSNNCGATWTNVYSKAGQVLATSAAITAPFIAPLAQDWLTETIALTGFATSNVIVKFRATNDNGNNLYLDNVNLSQANPSGIAKNNRDDANISIFPNPANSDVTLKIKSDNAGTSNIKVTNTIGQVVYTKQIAVNPGTNNFKLETKDLANGVYFVVIESGKNSTSKKLIISK
ncbi:MAG: T9SS type A sorting domain-containing protein [Bacteroidetes bacterium]|nr:T9SS type A sorting domain-containing protein [Bacteroidota bacterium]